MTRDRSGDRTVDEFMAELESDPEWVAMMKAKEEQRLRLAEQSFKNAIPILRDLASAGFHVDTIAELYNQRLHYKKAIPILLSWLPRIADPAVKESVIRALSVRWARPAAALPLVREFRQAPDSSIDSMRWAIANALSVVADDAVFDEIVRLVRDRRYGKDREMLAVALGNMKNPQAVSVLLELLDDEQVVGHAVMAIGKLKARDARSAVEKLALHPKKWIRKEVEKTLRRIDSRCDEAPSATGGST
jgi:hypothetical protein